MNAKSELQKRINFHDDKLTLFSRDEILLDWEHEWGGMPEFIMGDTEPVQKITVNFKTFEDAQDFAQIINQQITRATDSIWFPKSSNYISPKNYRYVDES